MWTIVHQTKPCPLAVRDVYMIASTVSSKILRSMATAEGFSFVETLTGFKWMANKAADLERQGKTVLLAFEEAIGERSISLCSSPFIVILTTIYFLIIFFITPFYSQ